MIHNDTLLVCFLKKTSIPIIYIYICIYNCFFKNSCIYIYIIIEPKVKNVKFDMRHLVYGPIALYSVDK